MGRRTPRRRIDDRFAWPLFDSRIRRPLHARGLPATLLTGLEALLDQGQEHLLFLVRLFLLDPHLPPEQVGLLKDGAEANVLPAGTETVRGLGRWLNGILARVHTKRIAPLE